VRNSVISPNARLHRWRLRRSSVLMDELQIGAAGPSSGHAILDKNVVVPDGAHVGRRPGPSTRRGTRSLDSGIVVLGRPTGAAVSEACRAARRSEGLSVGWDDGLDWPGITAARGRSHGRCLLSWAWVAPGSPPFEELVARGLSVVGVGRRPGRGRRAGRNGGFLLGGGAPFCMDAVRQWGEQPASAVPGRRCVSWTG